MEATRFCTPRVVGSIPTLGSKPFDHLCFVNGGATLKHPPLFLTAKIGHMIHISASVECPYCEQEHSLFSSGVDELDYFDTEVIDCQCGGRFTACIDLEIDIIQDRAPSTEPEEQIEFDPNQLTLF